MSEDEEDEAEGEPQTAAVSVPRGNIWKLPERGNAASGTTGERSDTLCSVLLVSPSLLFYPLWFCCLWVSSVFCSLSFFVILICSTSFCCFVFYCSFSFSFILLCSRLFSIILLFFSVLFGSLLFCPVLFSSVLLGSPSLPSISFWVLCSFVLSCSEWFSLIVVLPPPICSPWFLLRFPLSFVHFCSLVFVFSVVLSSSNVCSVLFLFFFVFFILLYPLLCCLLFS